MTIDECVHSSDILGAEIIEVNGNGEFYMITIKLKTGAIAEISAEYGHALLYSERKILTEEEKKDATERDRIRERWSQCYKEANGNLKKAKELYEGERKHDTETMV